MVRKLLKRFARKNCKDNQTDSIVEKVIKTKNEKVYVKC